jgi:hypothetical protein
MGTPEQRLTPVATTPEGMTPEGITPEGMTSEGTTSEGTMPLGKVPVGVGTGAVPRLMEGPCGYAHGSAPTHPSDATAAIAMRRL